MMVIGISIFLGQLKSLHFYSLGHSCNMQRIFSEIKLTSLCITHTVEHNYISPSSTVGIRLHWVQLHVSALYVGNLQIVI